MPLPQQDFDFARGEALEDASALSFEVTADRYPNGTVMSYRLRVFRPTSTSTDLFNVTGTDTVSDLTFKVPLTSIQTASIPAGSHGWLLWDEANSLKLAEGRVQVRKGKSE